MGSVTITVVEAEEGDSIAAVVVLTVEEVVALHHAEVVTTAVIVTDPVAVDLLPSWKAMVNYLHHPHPVVAVAVAGVDTEDTDHLPEAADSEADAVASVVVEGDEVDQEEEEEVEEAKLKAAKVRLWKLRENPTHKRRRRRSAHTSPIKRRQQQQQIAQSLRESSTLCRCPSLISQARH